MAEVAGRLGVPTHSMYEWRMKFGPAERRTEELDATQQELRRVKAELSRVTEERDYRKVYDDPHGLGESCGKHRVYRLMRQEGLQAQVGYRKRRATRGGKPAVVAPNVLAQQFDAEAPNQVWVTDITMIRTYEGWLYLAVVVDLYSRQVVCWSMQSRMQADLVLKA